MANITTKDITWINSPVTDPSSRVFQFNGKFFRAYHDSSKAQISALLQSKVLDKLQQAALIPRTEIANLNLAGYYKVLEVEKMQFSVRCSHFSLYDLKRSAMCWLDVFSELYEFGYHLSDAHFGNFMLHVDKQIKMVDLGSIQLLPKEQDLQPFCNWPSFWNNMLAPLLLMIKHPELDRVARLLIEEHPYYGPCYPKGQPPMTLASIGLDNMLEHEQQALTAKLQGHPIKMALKIARDYIEQLLPKVATGAFSKTVQHELDASSATNPMLVFGVESFAALKTNNQACIVIEKDDVKIHQFEAMPHNAHSAIAKLHPLNRLYIERPYRSEVVFITNVLKELHHYSQCKEQNICDLLLSSCSKSLILMEETELPHEFLALLTMHFSLMSINESNEFLMYKFIKNEE